MNWVTLLPTNKNNNVRLWMLHCANVSSTTPTWNRTIKKVRRMTANTMETEDASREQLKR